MSHLLLRRIVVCGLAMLAAVAAAQGYPPRALPLQSVRPFVSAAETAAFLGLPTPDAAADNESVLYYRMSDRVWCGAAGAACRNTRHYIIDHNRLRLAELEADGHVRAIGRARAQRWLAAPLTGFTTILLLPAALPLA